MRQASMILTLDDERAPSRNRTARSHWAARHREYKRIKHAVRCTFPAPVLNCYGFPLTGKAEVIVHGYYKGNVQDDDNVDTKPYVDALKTWIIVDDGPDYCTITGRAHRAKRDRVEIEIRWAVE